MLRAALAKHPILTNSLLYGSLYVGAEFSQQVISKKIQAKVPEPIDYPILGRYAFLGTVVIGPVLAYWYKWLDKTFVGTTTKIVVKKLAMDQFVLVPPLLVIFFVGMSIMERKPDLFEECKKKIVPTFKSSCMFWLPVQFVNFMLVPAPFRILYISTCSFAWVNILCWIKRQQY